jgi:hypothetical protein
MNINSNVSNSCSSSGDQRTAIQVLRQALTDLECVRGELVDPDLRPVAEQTDLTRNSITLQVQFIAYILLYKMHYMKG